MYIVLIKFIILFLVTYGCDQTALPIEEIAEFYEVDVPLSSDVFPGEHLGGQNFSVVCACDKVNMLFVVCYARFDKLYSVLL